MAINIKFPIEDDVIKNTFVKVNNLSKNAISSNLMLLLLTEKGSRYYDPEYGANLLKYIFEPSDGITHSDIEDDLKETVRKYLPEVELVKVNFNDSEENKLYLDIYYSYRSISGGVEMLQLVF